MVPTFSLEDDLSAIVSTVGGTRNLVVLLATSGRAGLAAALLVHAHAHAVGLPHTLLLSGDGRWLGAVIGAVILGGRRGLRTMRLVLGSMAAGPTQLAVTAIAVHTRLIEPSLALALLLGAVLVETTATTRRGVARKIVEAEEQLEDAREKDSGSLFDD